MSNELVLKNNIWLFLACEDPGCYFMMLILLKTLEFVVFLN